MAIPPVQLSTPQDNLLKTQVLAKSLTVEVVGRHNQQNRTTLMVTWVLPTAPTFPDQGGPHARYTILRPAAAWPVRSRLLATDLPTLPRAAHGGDPDHRPPHRLQPAALRPGVGPRTSLELSPRL